ncbi:alpha/beta fold hydrolase [Nonomuraea spiralis]|uniref:alpha/beta fold hydrolase n=1 Tax=Nonomuraea spiralis TaxID=46182 RepID=UPI0037B8FCE4
MDALGGTRYRLIAPDYPGFGHTRAPDDFVYSFDRLADVVEGFVQRIGLERFAWYAFDFGGPARHPRPVRGRRVGRLSGRTRRMDPRPALPRPARTPGGPARARAGLPLQPRALRRLAGMAARPPAAHADRVGT